MAPEPHLEKWHWSSVTCMLEKCLFKYLVFRVPAETGDFPDVEMWVKPSSDGGPVRIDKTPYSTWLVILKEL